MSMFRGLHGISEYNAAQSTNPRVRQDLNSTTCQEHEPVLIGTTSLLQMSP